ncbi:MAG: enoyl-CoA hydratase-related protein [Desulfobacterales bacterium]|nr:enoyl-CoA hydratase-related protein [Desulfobacterales bacterium]
MAKLKNTVEYEIKGHIGYVHIDNPPANILNRTILGSLEVALQALICDNDVLIIIITGRGEKFFAGGADINEFKQLNQKSGEIWLSFFQKVFSLIHHSTKVVIAAINGYALGGGCELALACDLRIASENAKFAQPEVNYNIIPGAGATQRLTHLIGLGRAKDLIFTGRIIDAKEAYQIGLVNRVVPHEQLINEAQNLAQEILNKGPIAIKFAKEAINSSLEFSLRDGLDLELSLFGKICATEDKNEGVDAFFEKRTPNFKGK